jgi:hypothetical protein
MKKKTLVVSKVEVSIPMFDIFLHFIKIPKNEQCEHSNICSKDHIHGHSKNLCRQLLLVNKQSLLLGSPINNKKVFYGVFL